MLPNSKIWIAAGVMLIGGSVMVLVARTSIQPSKSSSPYTVASVVRGRILQTVNTTGQLTPWTSVEVSTQISGLVTKVDVDFNSPVKKGQVLAEIDPSTYQQRLRQAEAEFAASQASQVLAKLNAQRLEGLRHKDLISQQEYDEAHTRLQQAQATLLTSKAAVDNARVDLERCTVTSPTDGVVIFKQVEVGKTVVSSFSAPTLFVIAEGLTKMRIIAPITEIDIWHVHSGQEVTFTVEGLAEHNFPGRLTQIRNPYMPGDKQQAQQQRPGQQNSIVSFDAVIEVDNRDLFLRPGLTANVSVIVEQRENALQIPNGALRVALPAEVTSAREMPSANDNGGATTATVYLLPSGDRNVVPRPVPVSLGISDSVVTEVLSGLKEGDEVVTGITSSWEPEKRHGLF